MVKEFEILEVRDCGSTHDHPLGCFLDFLAQISLQDKSSHQILLSHGLHNVLAVNNCITDCDAARCILSRSTMFTGVHGYVIGVIWLLGGIAYGGFLLATVFCCKNRRNEKLKKRLPCHKQCYLWPILLAIFFNHLSNFHSRAKTVVDIIIDTANNATKTMYNTTGAMKDMKESLGASNQSAAVQASSFLTSTSEQLDVEAADIQRQARKNRRLIDKGLKIVYIVTTVTISLNLAALIALSVCGTLRLRRPLHILIAVCWILTVLCWIFFGLYFFLQNFSRDSCTALESFQQNPYNNSLSSILPCDQLLSAKPVLFDVSQGIYSLVNQVNVNLSTIQGLPYTVCNPFSAPPEYQFQPDKCPSNAIRIGDIPQVLKVFTCSSFDNGTCASGQFISPNDYTTVEAYTRSIQSLLNVYPEMENLVECQTIHSNGVDIAVMVFLVLIWAKLAQHEQEHHSLDGSVKPHSSVAKEPETGTKDSSNHTSPVDHTHTIKKWSSLLGFNLGPSRSSLLNCSKKIKMITTPFHILLLSVS
ncbi:hypothetical protein NC651_036313 [Populus alba x Populus x berolinensis]|nr:hypothetical protein NC651_036313 [Populus alba x Populus x berolinensis]